MKTKIDDILADDPNSFIFDSGGFSMGTAFQTIYMQSASELRMMGELGYDAVTFGDHEFDYGARGTAQMLLRAAEAKRTVTERKTVKNPGTGRIERVVEEKEFMPRLVCSNIDWKSTLENDSDEQPTGKLRSAMTKYGVTEYSVIDKGGVKIAVFGLMGEEAAANTAEFGIEWTGYIDRAKEIVNEIKRNGEADLIVCLSHSGYTKREGRDSEDAVLAREVPDIDLIISGHSHTPLKEPVRIGDTMIVCAGANSEYLGQLVLDSKKNDFRFKKYELYKMDAEVKEDRGVRSEITGFKNSINSDYFNRFGMDHDDVLADSDFSFTPISAFGAGDGENTLGDFVADSFIYAVRQAEGSGYEDIACSVVPASAVTNSLESGEITAMDAFNVCPMGVGPDGLAGNPLVSFYLTGRELKMIPEIDASLADKDSSAIIHTGGLTYGFNDHRLYLNRAVDIRLGGGDGKAGRKIVNDRLYRVVAGLDTLEMADDLEAATHGLLSLVPKDRNGRDIEKYEDYVIKEDGREVKTWYAVASYLKSFDGKVPVYYKTTHGREVDETGFAPWKLFEQPNNYGIMMLAMIMIPIVILAGVIIAIRQRAYARRGYERTMFGERAGRRKTHRLGIEGGKRKQS